MKNRNIILGIDGVPFELMDNLSTKGIMPNFNQLKKNFNFRKLRSSIPCVSSVSWSSIITGKNPGEHGIYGFTEIIKNTYSLSFPNFNALKSKPFWIENPEKKHIIINVPSTYPAKEMNGIHIAGFIALDLENAVYPKKYVQKLHELGYEIDVDTKIAHQQSPDLFFDELFRILNLRKNTFNFLWEEIKWDTFMPVITGSDRIGHFLWHVYEDDKNPLHHRFLEYFHEIDQIIGEIYNKLNDDDTFIILSDHGMEKINYNVNLNTYLENQGFLVLTDQFKKYNRIKKGSKAFVLDSGRIYLNKRGYYPNGTVKEEDAKFLIEELNSLFIDLKLNNKKIIKKVYKKNEIYNGKMISNAPDLILVENKGFNLKAGIGKKDVFEKEKDFSGKHNENSFILTNKEIDIKNPTVEDVISLLG
ncbi:MAG: alkaline phosphatase family protein [Promethearchaeota archaeon]